MATGISTLGQSIGQISRLKTMGATLADLQLQLTSGKKTQKFSGLGTTAILSQRARADFNAMDTYMNNLSISNRRMELMITAIEELQAQAGNVANIVANELQEGEINLDRVNDLASNVIAFMEDLVNAQDGDRYLFSGSASSTQPLSLGGGTLQTYLQGQLADWQGETLSTSSLISSYRNVSDTIVGYNAAISNGDVGNVTVRADKNVEINYTTLANASGFKDIMVATQMMQELTVTDTSQVYHIDKIKLERADFEDALLPTDLPQTPPPGTAMTLPADFDNAATADELVAENQQRADNFFALFNDLGRMINNAIDDLDTLRFSLESSRAQVIHMQEQHTLDQNTLLGTISDVEDADISEVALSLNFMEIQLEASYRVTASISDLNLANFL